MKKSLKAILLKFDEKNRYETPLNFDYNQLMIKVKKLNSSLNQKFGSEFVLDAQIQDASFFCDIRIPKEFVIVPKPNLGYSIRISNFGFLATINFYEEFTSQTIEKIIEELSRNNFIYIDAKYLFEPYDGDFEEFKKILDNLQPSWYDRYFDYL